MDTIIEKGQEYIVIDGIKMPIYQMDPDYRSPHKIPCMNCRFSSMSEEEQAEAIESIREVMETIDGDDKEG